MRVQAAAVVVERPAHPAGQVRAAHDGPRHQVGMPAQVLGGTVEAQVEPGLQRPEVHRGRERVVDHREQALPAGEVRDLAQQPDPHQRVGDRLDQERPGLRGARGGPGLGAVYVDEAASPAEVPGVAGEEVVGAAVQAVAGQQVIPGAQHAQQRGRHRRHAQRGRDRCLRALQGGQLVMQVPLRRRGTQPEVRDVVVPGSRLDRVHRSLVDRVDHRAFGSRPPLPAVDHHGLHRLALSVHTEAPIAYRPVNLTPSSNAHRSYRTMFSWRGGKPRANGAELACR